MDEIEETELAAAGRSGSVVDGAGKDKKRIVRAGLIRRCCLELKDQIDPRGLRLNNAIIDGSLDMSGMTVPFPLRFDGCEFDSAPLVEGAQLFELSLTGCPRLPGLLGNGLKVRRDLNLSGSRIVGAHRTSVNTTRRSAVWLCESEIGGRLLLVDTTVDGQGDRAIHADRIQVRGSVRFIHGFGARGAVRLMGARIGGSMDLTGAKILASGSGPALDLRNATMEGSVFLIADSAGHKPEIRGRFDIGSSRIASRFLIRDAILDTNTDVPLGSIYTSPSAAGEALSAARLSVGAEMMLDGHCEVTGKIDLSMSDMSSMFIGKNCRLRAPGRTALNLTNAEIRSLVRLDENAAVQGTIRLVGAHVHGTLALHGQVSQPEQLSLVAGSVMTVDGEVYLSGLRASGGQVNFRGATMGTLNADGAQLHNPRGYTVSLSQATVRGSVRLVDGFTSTGLAVLSRSVIEGQLQFTGASFTCPAPAPHNMHGHAIEAISAAVRGGMDLGWETASPSVDFTDLTTTFLADDPATWPPRFTIAGLTYDRYETPQGAAPKPLWDQAARCAWLNRQTHFDSGPYEQAARVFRQYGYTSQAEQILIAQQKACRKVGRPTAAWPRRIADMLYAIIGYGYRPWRVLVLLAVLLALVAASLKIPATQATLRANNGSGAIYTTSGPLIITAAPGAVRRNGSPHANSCGDGEVRCFSPILYAVDTVIPLISLDQRSTWYPDTSVPDGGLVLWWLNLATLLGWLLSSIFVVSLARLSRSQ
jgi:hypothetical protein